MSFVIEKLSIKIHLHFFLCTETNNNNNNVQVEAEKSNGQVKWSVFDEKGLVNLPFLTPLPV